MIKMDIGNSVIRNQMKFTPVSKSKAFIASDVLAAQLGKKEPSSTNYMKGRDRRQEYRLAKQDNLRSRHQIQMNTSKNDQNEGLDAGKQHHQAFISQNYKNE